MPEAQAIGDINWFYESLALFNSNYRDYLNTDTFLCESEQGSLLLDIRREAEFYYVLRVILKHFYNTVAAAFTLRDHAYALYNTVYKPKNEFTDYKQLVSQTFTDDNVVQFIHDIRNYMSHVKLLPVAHVLYWDTVKGEIRQIVLSKASLLEYGTWKALSKALITEYDGENIPLKPLLIQYAQRINSFYSLVRAKQQEIHEKDLLKIDEIRVGFFASHSDQAIQMITNELPLVFTGYRSVYDILEKYLFGNEQLVLYDKTIPADKRIEAVITLINSRIKLPENLKMQLLQLPNEII